MNEFLLLHQPKTAGTFATRSLPHGYVLPHNQNYHFCVKNNIVKENQELVCIARNPIDYYISLITFWCLDDRWNATIKDSEEVRAAAYKAVSQRYDSGLPTDSHPSFFMSEGYLADFDTIINNIFNDDFLEKYSNVLSKKHHTYDYYVFREMKRLNIGYYTFAFLDQYSSKKITDIKSNEECLEEIVKIKSIFTIIKTSSIESDLAELTKRFNIKFTPPNSKPMSSNRKPIEEYNIEGKLLETIKKKDEHIFNQLF